MLYLTRTVIVLSLVSMFTDISSEMLYPVMPLYLKEVGFSVLLIGILEGVAEATAGLSKGYFGRLSDNTGRRLPFVQLGYLLSALSKPLLAVSRLPALIFSARTIDRLGKGLRTGARDAILSAETTPEHKGKVFGFHRGMDTLGAVIGPLAALWYLQTHPAEYRTLFLLAFIPGLLGVGFTFFLKDKTPEKPIVQKKNSLFIGFHYWAEAPTDYKKLVAGLIIWAFFNSSDVFLLLKAKQAGLTDPEVIGLYIFYNLVYAIAAFPLGILADKFGLKKIFILGLMLFAVVYAGFAVAENMWAIGGLFLIYGLYAAATEGIAKAWISNMVAKEDVATSIGAFAGFSSLAALGASSLAGFLWWQLGPLVAFGASAVVAFAVGIYLSVAVPEK